MTNYLLHVKTNRHCVVAMSCSGRPCRFLTRDHMSDEIEVMHLIDGQIFVEHSQTSFVCKELSHGDSGFTVLRKFRPVVRDWGLVVEPPARVRHGKCHRSESLGSGHDNYHSVFSPRLV